MQWVCFFFCGWSDKHADVRLLTDVGRSNNRGSRLIWSLRWWFHFISGFTATGSETKRFIHVLSVGVKETKHVLSVCFTQLNRLLMLNEAITLCVFLSFVLDVFSQWDRKRNRGEENQRCRAGPEASLQACSCLNFLNCWRKTELTVWQSHKWLKKWWRKM